MLRSIPFHPDMKLNLSFEVLAFSQFHTSDDGRVFDNVNTLENLMRTRVQNLQVRFLLLQSSHLLISTSFDFHLFDFLVKGRQMSIVCVCVCALLCRSLVTVSGHLATREFRHQELDHHATNQLAAK